MNRSLNDRGGVEPGWRSAEHRPRLRSRPAPPRPLVALLGTSADPPHLGHAALVRWVLRGATARDPNGSTAAARAAAVWILPVFRHRFHRKARHMSPYRHRLAMCRLAFEPLSPRVKIVRVEEQLGGAPATVDTLRHLQRCFPGLDFALVLGADAYAELKKGLWKQSGQLLATATFIVAPRRRHAAANRRLGLGRPFLPDISSSRIRALGEDAARSGSLAPAVRRYIRQHALYGAPGTAVHYADETNLGPCRNGRPTRNRRMDG